MSIAMDTHFKQGTLWYKDAVIYELHIKSFYDSNDDGIGDIRGLIQKLDYLKELGITALWLLPFYPSPRKDDGYDIADYRGVHPDYGNLKDFRFLLREAHDRGIRIITELVVNHTSDQNPWFQRARHAKSGSLHRDYYVWSDSADMYREARIIFKDFEASNWSWDPVAHSYFWHRFYSHQPDLNYDNPQVEKEIHRILDFWFAMGVDGLRLDAVPYLYEREGTSCENLPETHAFLKRLRRHVDERFTDRILIAEANQWPEDTVAYYGDGDECHMAFHFPIMPRLFMALRSEDRFPIIDILDQTPTILESCQWAMFLRNHDELTLEMVTDEERDYMYAAYARDARMRINLGIRRRLAPLLDNDRRRIELMNILLFSLPGTPVLYYGDEIGMGDNYYLGDRDGVRTPMHWSGDRNAGFSRANPQSLYLPVIIDPEYHYEAVNVENQQQNPASLLWWMKRAVSIRKRYRALPRGSIEFLMSENPKVLTFARVHGDETFLVVANLSRFSQYIEVDLSEYSGRIPVDVFSGQLFPGISGEPYLITLSPYGYYWFSLEPEVEKSSIPSDAALPEILVPGNWTGELSPTLIKELETRVLPRYLNTCSWFQDRIHGIRSVSVDDRISVSRSAEAMVMLILLVEYPSSTDRILLPLYWHSSEKPPTSIASMDRGAIARVHDEKARIILYDGIYHEGGRRMLLHLILEMNRVRGRLGHFQFEGRRHEMGHHRHHSQLVSARKGVSSMVLGDEYLFKLYHILEPGIRPEQEVVAFLSEKQRFPYVAPYLGKLVYEEKSSNAYTVGLLQSFTHQETDAWTLTTDAVRRYFIRVLSGNKNREMPPERLTFGLSGFAEDKSLEESIGALTLDQMRLLGRRTAELHIALSSSDTARGFVPEAFSNLSQRSLYQTLRSRMLKGFQSVKAAKKKTLPAREQEELGFMISNEEPVLDFLKFMITRTISGKKIRIHGNYDLRQIYYTGRDFLIVNFSGDQSLPSSQRRLMDSCLKDVASLLCSLHEAVFHVLHRDDLVRPEDVPDLGAWSEIWFRYLAALILTTYRERLSNEALIPDEDDGYEMLMIAFMLEKTIQEIQSNLVRSPESLLIPLKAFRLFIRARSMTVKA